MPNPDVLLTVAEAAHATGESVRTLERWIYEDVIAVERVGPYKRVRIRLSTLTRMYPVDTLRIRSHDCAAV